MYRCDLAASPVMSVLVMMVRRDWHLSDKRCKRRDTDEEEDEGNDADAVPFTSPPSPPLAAVGAKNEARVASSSDDDDANAR